METIVPTGARAARVTLTATWSSGAYNDGYADDLKLTINGGPNLIVNGSAEAGLAGWTVATGAMEAAVYGVEGSYGMNPNAPSPLVGTHFFGGGLGSASSAIYQTIDISALATVIDAGAARFFLSAWLGGFLAEADVSTVTIEWKDGAGGALGSTVTLGPVGPLERSYRTCLLFVAYLSDFPLRVEYGSSVTSSPEIIVHRFGHGDASAEQRFILGDGVTRWSLSFARLSPLRAATLQAFYNQQRAETIPFVLSLQMPDGSTSTFTARFDGPLSITTLAGGVFKSATVKLCEVPREQPVYTTVTELTRFPDSGALAALLNDTVEVIPALVIAGTVFLSNRAMTLDGQNYEPRILDWSEITQSIDGAADQFQVTLGNADRFFSTLARSLTLYGAQLQFSLFIVNNGTLLNLWSGEINNFDDDPADKFTISAGDPVWNLRKNYPVLSVDRNDPQFQVPDQPVAVHSGGNRITSTSIASDTVYGQPVQDVWCNDSKHPLKVPCQVLSGRDESQYYAALGIVGRGPIGSFYQLSDHWHTLDGQPWHGVGDSDPSKRNYGLRRSYGGNPGTGDPASKDNSPDPGSNYFALDSTSTTWPQNGQPIDGVAFLQIRRTDASGIQPVAVSTHDMEAYIEQGLGGWVWSAPGTKSWTQHITNPIWIAVNTFLVWKSAQFAGSAPCAAMPSPLPGNWSSGSGAPTSTPADGAVYIDSTAKVYYSRLGGAWQAMGDYAVNLAKLYWYATATAAQLEACFDCVKAIADAAICDIAVTPLFARNVNVNYSNISGPPSNFPLPSNWTIGSGAPSSTAADGTIYIDASTEHLYAREGGAWVLIGIYTPQDLSHPIYQQGGYTTVSQAVTSEPQFACAGVMGPDGSGNPRPLRDVLRDVLGSCLGFFNFCFGKLRTGIAYSASVTDAFTVGNTLYNSYGEGSRAPGFTRLEVTFSDSDYNYSDNSLGYEDKEVLLVAGRSVKKARVWGVTTKSQAARITAVKAREEIGGTGTTAMMNARTHELRTTVLGLSVEPGAVVSYTGPKTGGATVKFRVTKWSLAKDFSLTIQGTTVVDEMYDLTSGPKPADVAPGAIPGRSLAGLRPLPVLPIIVSSVSYPFLTALSTDGSSLIISGEYCPPLPVHNFIGVTVYVEIPTGSGSIVCAGDFDYTGDRNATDDQVWGVFCARFPLPATDTETWTVWLVSRTSALRAQIDSTAPHVVITPGASGVFAAPITSFSMTVEIEGTLAEGGGVFTVDSAGVLTRTGDSTHLVGHSTPGAQSYQCTFDVGVPADATVQGIYVVHAIFPDGTFAAPDPATGSGWFGDGFGVIINQPGPTLGAVCTCHNAWHELLAGVSYQEFSARTYNFNTPPVSTAPPSGMIQKAQLPAGFYQSQLFLVNGA
jgi:hypothetical protein